MGSCGAPQWASNAGLVGGPMRHALRSLIALIPLASVVGCSSCEERRGTDAGGDMLVAPLERKSVEVAPLPLPPAIDVEPGALPGYPAGPLAVVSARPQGELEGNERIAITFNKPITALGALDEEMPVP